MCTESMSQIDMLNMIYEPIVNKKDELYNTLIEKGYNINWGYFTHHMLRRDNELLRSCTHTIVNSEYMRYRN